MYIVNIFKKTKNGKIYYLNDLNVIQILHYIYGQ